MLFRAVLIWGGLVDEENNDLGYQSAAISAAVWLRAAGKRQDGVEMVGMPSRPTINSDMMNQQLLRSCIRK